MSWLSSFGQGVGCTGGSYKSAAKGSTPFLPTMTVKELIEKLQDFDPDLEVLRTGEYSRYLKDYEKVTVDEIYVDIDKKELTLH
jgi:hypothetical protein